MNILLILFISVLLISVKNINIVLADSIKNCRTPPPENHNGWCVPTKHCKIISDIRNVSLEFFPPMYQTFIANSKCPDESQEQFCCTLVHINREFAILNGLTNSINPTVQRVDDEDNVPQTIKPSVIPFIPNVNRADILNIDSHPNLYLLPDECGLMKHKNKISYGESTGLREFPFMALLQFDREQPYFGCSGTLINEKYVLTAAHCIRSNLFNIRLGEHNINTEDDCEEDEEEDNVLDCNDPVQDIAIESITKHAKFDKFKAVHDIALIRLSKPANTSTNNVHPICLPINFELRNIVFDRGQLSGWGTTEKNKPSHILLKGVLNINAEREKCENFYYENYSLNVTNRLICATGKKQVDSCKGDSGGPLFQQRLLRPKEFKKYLQFGIIASGPSIDCGSINQSGGSLYTNVSRYMKWILDNINP